MEILENICEYYDELFPIAEGQKDFFKKASLLYSKPVKFLSVNCGTGLFEHQLATEGANVTAIENEQDLLESANRRRRTQVMMLNFFKMSTLEMGRFLGKGFFNVASILNGRLIFISDDILLEKFFFDMKQLLCKDGMLVVSVPNFEKFNSPKFTLPKRQSIRSSLTTKVSVNSSGEPILYQELETGNGRILHVTEAKINLLTREKISETAKKSGFSEAVFYADFKESDFSKDSDNLVAVIR